MHFIVLSILHSADATSRDPSTGKKYFQPTIPSRVITPNRDRERNGYRDGGQESHLNSNLNFNLNSPRDAHRNVVPEERGEILNGYTVNSRYNVDRIIDNDAAREVTVFSPRTANPINLTGSNRIPSGSKRTPLEVYNDLMRKDKERLQRKKIAQLQYQVCPYACPFTCNAALYLVLHSHVSMTCSLIFASRRLSYFLFVFIQYAVLYIVHYSTLID